MSDLLSSNILPDYFESVHLQEKGNYIFGLIRKYFDTDSWPEKTTWERRLEYSSGHF